MDGKGNIQLEVQTVSKSFTWHNRNIDNTYLRDIQIRTIHRELFTNGRLHKIGIKSPPLCNFSKTL